LILVQVAKKVIVFKSSDSRRIEMADKILPQSAYTAVINAPIEWVDIADWLLHLPDGEYQRCAPPDHIAAGYTTSDDGRPMSINVEQIGTGLVIQHYIGEVTRSTTATWCRTPMFTLHMDAQKSK
jgi:hypothetical protein